MKKTQAVKKKKASLNIFLRLMERQDIPTVVNWLMSADYKNNNLSDYPVEQKNELKNRLLKEITFSKIPNAGLKLLVTESEGGILTGLAILKKINWQSRNLEVQIYVPADFRQTNVPQLVTREVYDFLFCELNMHKVYLYVPETNTQVLENHKKHGHEPEAVLNKYFSDGKKNIDLYIFSVFKKDIVK